MKRHRYELMTKSQFLCISFVQSVDVVCVVVLRPQ